MANSDSYLEELEEIKQVISTKESNISKIKGIVESKQEEVVSITEELERKGLTFDSIEDIENYKNEKEVRIQRLLRNYRQELGMD